MDQHYHPIIYRRLQGIFDSKEWDMLQPYLSSLSNAHFRTAGYLMGERLLPTVSREDFWKVMQQLVLWQPKAFTVTIGKAALLRLKSGTLSLDDAGFRQLSGALNGERHTLDRQKLLRLWLPSVEKPTTMQRLFDDFAIADAQRRVEFLLHVNTKAAAFELLRNLRFEEHNRDYLADVCRQVMKRADGLSFNLASLLREYFDLSEIRGTFSLRIQPFELSRLDTDYEVFCRIITKV